MQNKWRSAFGSVLWKSGDFFRSRQWKEIFVFLLFLTLSFGFWLMQTLQQDFERRIEFPLRYTNVPSEWVLSEDNPDTISVLFKEKGTTLLYYFWKGRFKSIDISVAALQKTPDMPLRITGLILETELSKKLNASTSIVYIEPRDFELHYDLLGSKVVPVSAQVTVATRQGFQLSDEITVSHSEVQLFGSSKMLDTLKYVKTRPVALEDVSSTREVTAYLDLPTGVKSDTETVTLTIPVEEYTEKKVRLSVQCSDIPENYILRMFPSIVEVTCYIPLSQFRELTAEKLEIIIPYEEFSDNQATGKVPVRVTRKPEYVTNPIVVPDELEFIIEQHD